MSRTPLEMNTTRSLVARIVVETLEERRLLSASPFEPASPLEWAAASGPYVVSHDHHDDDHDDHDHDHGDHDDDDHDHDHDHSHATPAPSADILAAALADFPAADAAPFPLADTFELHSLPGATKTIYLDFDGHTTTDPSWNNGITFVTPAYSIDSDKNNFSTEELEAIQMIWARVAEDYAPFNINVTTEDPGAGGLTRTGIFDSTYGTRVVIGGNGQWRGPDLGGTAILNSFAANRDIPSFVFSENLLNNEKYVAEAASHEPGHTFGLQHDGTLVPDEEYFTGHGSGSSSWGPIMGGAYLQTVTQWSRGEYNSASETEDDLAIIAGVVGYRSDDHGDSLGAATNVNLTTSYSELDSGFIGRVNDVDYFKFTLSSAADVDIDFNPAEIGPNLDIFAQLRSSSGSVLQTSNPSDDLSASISASLAPGDYFVTVDGTGNRDPRTNGYSDYGSLGNYTISGSFTPTVSSDNNDQISEAQAMGAVTTAGVGIEGYSISPSDDVDMLSFTVGAGQRVGIDLDRQSGSTLDSYLRLFNSSGTQLASNNDGAAPGEGSSPSSYIEYTFSNAGTYYVGVSSNGNSSYNAVSGTGDTAGNSTGLYNVTAKLIPVVNDDANDQISEASNLGTLSASPIGIEWWSINPTTDVDMYSFTASAGQRVAIDIDRRSGGLDSYIRLFDAAGNQLAVNNNGAAPGESTSADSYLEYNLGSSGTYYIGVSAVGNNTYNPITGTGDGGAFTTGAFDLNVWAVQNQPDGDSNDQISEARDLGAVTTGGVGIEWWSINPNSDVDMLKFTVSAGQRVGIDVDRRTDGFDSYLRLFDGSGNQLAANDNGAAPGEGASQSSYIEYTFANAGTYYIGVSSAGNQNYSATAGSGDSAGVSTGSFDLIVKSLQTEPDNDSNDQIFEANDLGAASGSPKGVEWWSINPGADVDMFSFTVNGGQTVAFDVDRRSGGLDSYLRLFNASGTQLAVNNNGTAPGESSSTDSYFTYTFSTGGTYYIGVSSAGNTGYSAISGIDTGSGATGQFDFRLWVV